MYSSFQLAKKFLSYYFTALNGKGHGVHSPFVFDFIRCVLQNKKHVVSPPEIEQLRKNLLRDERLLPIEDLGAGSRIQKSSSKKIKEVAATAVKPEKYARLLFRLVKHYQPQTIIELGTSLGITTSYLSVANPAAQVVTIEGSEVIWEAANENFQTLQLKNIRSLNGNFDVLLPQVLQHLKSVDLGYIDGNHRYEPTLDYFHQFLQKSGNDTILIFDDIHWSREMETAWFEIQQHPAVRCTLDIFFMGFALFRQEFREKQHFTIRF